MTGRAGHSESAPAVIEAIGCNLQDACISFRLWAAGTSRCAVYVATCVRASWRQCACMSGGKMVAGLGKDIIARHRAVRETTHFRIAVVECFGAQKLSRERESAG